MPNGIAGTLSSGNSAKGGADGGDGEYHNRSQKDKNSQDHSYNYGGNRDPDGDPEDLNAKGKANICLLTCWPTSTAGVVMTTFLLFFRSCRSMEG